MVEGFVAPDALREAARTDDAEPDRRHGGRKGRISGADRCLSQHDRPEARKRADRDREDGNDEGRTDDQSAFPADLVDKDAHRRAGHPVAMPATVMTTPIVADVQCLPRHEIGREKRADAVFYIGEKEIERIQRPLLMHLWRLMLQGPIAPTER